MCSGEKSFETNAYMCKTCYLSFNRISPGDQCQQCGRWSELAKGWKMQVDSSEERRLYSGILTEAEQKAYFPDLPLPVNICENCVAKADEFGYLAQDATLATAPTYEGKNIFGNFSDRSAMSSLGLLIVRDVLEAAGYEIKVSSFEETHSHLKSLNRSPDRSESLIRLSSNPDLEVTDKDAGNIYRVEVKTTTQAPDEYRLDAQVVTRLRNYHDDAFLLVYHIPSARMFVRKIRDINWDMLPLIKKEGESFYQLQFAHDGVFLDIEDVFGKVTTEIMHERLRIMRELFRKYFVGLELSSHYTINSF